MPGAEDTKMNKTIVLPQPVKENRLIKKVGSELREQRRDSGNIVIYLELVKICRLPFIRTQLGESIS